MQMLLYAQAPLLSLSTVSRHPADWYPNGKSVARDYPDCELDVGKRRFEGGSARTFARGQCSRPVVAGAPAQVFVAGDSHAMAYIRTAAARVRIPGRRYRCMDVAVARRSACRSGEAPALAVLRSMRPCWPTSRSGRSPVMWWCWCHCGSRACPTSLYCSMRRRSWPVN